MRETGPVGDPRPSPTQPWSFRDMEAVPSPLPPVPPADAAAAADDDDEDDDDMGMGVGVGVVLKVEDEDGKVADRGRWCEGDGLGSDARALAGRREGVVDEPAPAPADARSASRLLFWRFHRGPPGRMDLGEEARGGTESREGPDLPSNVSTHPGPRARELYEADGGRSGVGRREYGEMGTSTRAPEVVFRRGSSTQVRRILLGFRGRAFSGTVGLG